VPAELARLLLGSFPYVLCTTLAALILWGENIRIYYPKLILYSVLASIAQSLTYYIEIEQLRIIIEVIVCFFLVLVIFRAPVKWGAKIYATSFVFGFICGGLISIIAIFVFKTSYMELLTPIVWMTVGFPIYILLIGLVYLIRQKKIPGLSLIYSVQKSLKKYYLIYIAILIQMIIFYWLSVELVIKNNSDDYIRILGIFVGFFVPFIISIYLILKFIQKTTREVVISTQDAVSENIMELINSVRGQRHDFLNHLQIINALIQQKEWSALDKYLRQLLKEVSEYNDILKFENPIIAALLNSKISQANLRGVSIKADIRADFAGLAAYSMDIARILGNLIDNAIEAVEASKKEKEITLEICEKGPLLSCSVSNKYSGSLEVLEKIFEPEFTTKVGAHSGIGLNVCRQLAQKLNGTLEYYIIPQDSLISFTLTIPKSKLH
jgi:two-component system sensor histidine kinase AgrC